MPAQQPTITRVNGPTRRMSDKLKFTVYAWVDWAIKAVIIAVFTLVWRNNEDMQNLKAQIAAQTSAQSIVNADTRSEIAAIKAGFMSRVEVLENLKRIEQNQQIQIQQFKIEALEKKGRK